MEWKVKKILERLAAEDDDGLVDLHACSILTEVTRLNNARCWACDGFGHVARDCPTHEKLKKVKGSIREQAKIMTAVFNEC